MKRVIVIGCPGSGKSTFSRALSKKTNLPLYHLDMMYWNEDGTTVEKAEFTDSLDNILKKEEWIIDGNYASTMEKRMAACDTVFFLDYTVDVCLDGIRSRRGKKRSDIPWMEPLDYCDKEFVEFVMRYNEDSRPQVLELINNNCFKNIIIFKTREESEEYIKSEQD